MTTPITALTRSTSSRKHDQLPPVRRGRSRAIRRDRALGQLLPRHRRVPPERPHERPRTWPPGSRPSPPPPVGPANTGFAPGCSAARPASLVGSAALRQERAAGAPGRPARRRPARPGRCRTAPTAAAPSVSAAGVHAAAASSAATRSATVPRPARPAGRRRWPARSPERLGRADRAAGQADLQRPGVADQLRPAVLVPARSGTRPSVASASRAARRRRAPAGRRPARAGSRRRSRGPARPRPRQVRAGAASGSRPGSRGCVASRLAPAASPPRSASPGHPGSRPGAEQPRGPGRRRTTRPSPRTTTTRTSRRQRPAGLAQRRPGVRRLRVEPVRAGRGDARVTDRPVAVLEPCDPRPGRESSRRPVSPGLLQVRSGLLPPVRATAAAQGRPGLGQDPVHEAVGPVRGRSASGPDALAAVVRFRRSVGELVDRSPPVMRLPF